jgi:hypothetical protein
VNEDRSHARENAARTLDISMKPSIVLSSTLQLSSPMLPDSREHSAGCSPSLFRRKYRMLACHMVPISGGECCDFCTVSPICKLYTCTNFAVKGRAVFWKSRRLGVWAACRKCTELAEAERWSALTERALRKFLQRHSVPRHEVPAMRSQFTEVVRLFSEHRIKPEGQPGLVSAVIR